MHDLGPIETPDQTHWGLMALPASTASTTFGTRTLPVWRFICTRVAAAPMVQWTVGAPPWLVFGADLEDERSGLNVSRPMMGPC